MKKQTPEETEILRWRCRNCQREIEVPKHLARRGVVYCTCSKLTKQNLVLIKRKPKKDESINK